jgi:hypothetical protein
MMTAAAECKRFFRNEGALPAVDAHAAVRLHSFAARAP